MRLSKLRSDEPSQAEWVGGEREVEGMGERWRERGWVEMKREGGRDRERWRERWRE